MKSQFGKVHIYCGDGKGKTTAAMGLGLRAAGRGNKVLLVQFLKGGNSGERAAIAHVPGFDMMEAPELLKFVFQMTPEEKAAEAARCAKLLDDAAEKAAKEGYDLLLLDELCGAVTTGLVSVEQITRFLDTRRAGLEVVMTGRDPVGALRDRADYITEMRKVKHPFDQGGQAREGIEF